MSSPRPDDVRGAECGRHMTAQRQGWHTVRCAHLGSAFVVEFHHVGTGWSVIDFVDGEAVETPVEWDEATARMRAGGGPFVG